ncbi:M15 family metallopeptidase [Metabacillus sp. RGM 3146]|uniref:M15 family metallopeptidase n=1 Tax=Metabacillus sp. RGM 3146 TaxID=3401092 RepID=UPI003B9C8D00
MKHIMFLLLLFSFTVMTACSPQHSNEVSPASKEKTAVNKQSSERPLLSHTTKKGANGQTIVTNPEDILVLVNKKRLLPSDYIPRDLVIPNIPWAFKENLEKKHLRKPAASAAEKLFQKAKEEGISLIGQSGYRSYSRQKSIFAFNTKQSNKEEANQVSAIPGESEHQTGLALDVTSPEVNYELTEEFGQTKEGIWLKEHAADFGFIIRYQKGKESITGYQYEPWHIRFVGEEAAKFIVKNGLTLEQYFKRK